MIRLTTVLCLMALTSWAFAQQRAGDEASTDTQGTFQALVDACDDVDALMLRARIRLQLSRTTEEAAAQSQRLLEDGFATCANGDIETAKAQLTKSLTIAEAGVAERFAVDEPADTAPSADESISERSQELESDKPWWRFW